MGKANIHLITRKDEFLDYNIKRFHILGKAEVIIELNSWATQQKISVIAGNHQSILGRDLMGSLGLELFQRDRVMTVADGNPSAEGGACTGRVAVIFLQVVPKNIFQSKAHTQCQGTGRFL